MHLGMLLQMAADGIGRPRSDRVPRTAASRWPSWPRGPAGPAPRLAERPTASGSVLVDLNSEAVPLALFGAGLAGKPFVPVNYRLTDDQLRAIVRPHGAGHGRSSARASPSGSASIDGSS